ncbi:NAD(P)-binding domain-containing protein (plasmid) [Agrobacterium tumefaciens]|uniref:NAD(P)-binding domain-containing protein n=1 Tax=Agrobacterium tumefaciens TaxID=358 RepID=A0AAJ4TDE4_AGRTU|nr:NAD(P)-binding domain-containing protein [Agrobacterium tumefaciens]
MSIGIIGAGNIGSNFARALAKLGISAVISNSRGPESLSSLVQELGPAISAGTVGEAASADIVIAALPWRAAEKVFSELPAWNGRIIIDCTNPIGVLDPASPEGSDPGNPLAAYGLQPIDLGGRTSSEVFAQFVPAARVVKAFNHIGIEGLTEPQVGGGKRVIFISGDDASAKAEVQKLIEAMGAFPVDLGTLHIGGLLASFPFGVLADDHFIKIGANNSLD